MFKNLLKLILCSALYGASIGALYGLPRALDNLIKFPLLLLVTALICAFSSFLVAQLFGAKIRFLEVQRLMGSLYTEASLLLLSLSSVNLFLALIFEAPSSGTELNDYPLFLTLNLLFISLAGTLALIKQGWRLLQEYQLSLRVSLTLITSWLLLALVVGGQWSWYLRPFFGIAAVEQEEAPFCEGLRPDYRGASNFFEAVYNLTQTPKIRSLKVKKIKEKEFRLH